ncbi:MAG: response regulator [Magnetospirillum sp.]|nr:response regulator [Magnetospirillum sp.]
MRHMKNSFDVLLVEDDLGDAGLVRIAVNGGSHACKLHHVKTGNDAISFLRRASEEWERAPRPDLVLLDLNLPGRSGHEVLADVKNDPSLWHIPVVVLSTSQAERDVLKSYELGANSFVTKPMEVDAFTSAIHAIENYWFDVAQLPV